MSGWLSRRLVERGIIKEEEQEIYQFGIRNGMIILLNVLTAFLIGLVTEKLLWFFEATPEGIIQTAAFSAMSDLIWCCLFRYIQKCYLYRLTIIF